MPIPTTADVTAYLEGAGLPVPEAAILASAISAETAAQAKVVRVPDAGYSSDLIEALCRRVAHNLAVRPLALGVQVQLSDTAIASNNVGGLDAEVRRLEAPYRKRVVA
jgi:hypothetical protein